MSPETSLALKLWVVLNRAMHSVEEHLRHQVERHGLSMTEFAVLEVLLNKGTLPIGEIGDRVLRTSGSMTYVIDKLQQRGLIRRRACAADRRIQYAELTPEGQTLIGAVFTEHAALILDLMGALSMEEQHVAIELIRRLGVSARDRQQAPEATA